MAEITSPRRGKTNGYSNHHLHAKQNQKRKDAETRNAKYAALSLKDKFSTLVVGGSKKQRAKLEKLAAQPLVEKIAKKAKATKSDK